MSDKRYPTRMHEVLGVEAGREFSLDTLCPAYLCKMDEEGVVRDNLGREVKSSILATMINNPERITRRPLQEDDGKRGLYSKYKVTKADGTPLDGDCFVLRPDRDEAAIRALEAYADATNNENLAADIREWLQTPRRPRLTEEAQEKEDHIIRLERMRSQKDQWANGKHAHWLETPADHAKDRDALDAAIKALTGKSRLTEEQVKRLRALIALEAMYLAKNKDGSVGAFVNKPTKNALYWNTNDSYVFYLSIVGTCLSELVSWEDPEPLDIVQTLRDAGVEVDDA